MSVNNVFLSIDNLKEKYTQFMCDICRFEARAYDKETIDKMIDFIEKFAKDDGFLVKRVPFEKCGDFLVVELNPSGDKGCVLMAHLDTVHEKGAFGEVPVKIDGDKIIGPGVIDCKGGAAIALLLMKALKENGYNRHIKLLLTTDEEISNTLGGKREIDFFYSEVKGFPHAINCETSEGDEVCISRKGILRYQLKINGVGGHSGIHYFECKNAILEAANKIVAIQSNSKKCGTTFSCNMVNGGTAFNIIPNSCTVNVDIRVVAEKDIEPAIKVIEDIANTSFVEGTSCVATLLSCRPPMEKREETMVLFNKLKATAEKYGLGSLTAVSSGGGADGCYTQAAGVVTICGMGGCGGFCHTNKEYIEIKSIETRAKIISAFLLNQEKEHL